MKSCIGFPQCREKVEDTDIACKKCWEKIPRRDRQEMLALAKRFHGTKQYEIKKEAIAEVLNARLKKFHDQEEDRKRFTVVG